MIVFARFSFINSTAFSTHLPWYCLSRSVYKYVRHFEMDSSSSAFRPNLHTVLRSIICEWKLQIRGVLWRECKSQRKQHVNGRCIWLQLESYIKTNETTKSPSTRNTHYLLTVVIAMQLHIDSSIVDLF